MNVTTNDLETVGFVPYQFWGVAKTATKRSETQYGLRVSNTRYVHWSIARQCKGLTEDQKDYPVLYWVGSREQFEAKWGALTFALRTRHQLHQFMTLMEYPLSVEQRTFLYDL